MLESRDRSKKNSNHVTDHMTVEEIVRAILAEEAATPLGGL